MILDKWNYVTKEYDPYEIPNDWKVSVMEEDLDTLVNCAHCGLELTFGQCYTSQEIHTLPFGFGYGVCEKCYEGECERRKEAGK